MSSIPALYWLGQCHYNVTGKSETETNVSPLCLYVAVRENVRPVSDSAVLGFMQKGKN